MENRNVIAIVINGEKWVPITEPDGWKNTVTGETASPEWMENLLRTNQGLGSSGNANSR